MYALFTAWVAISAVSLALLLTVLILPFLVLPRGKREKYTIQVTRLYSWVVLRFCFLARLDVRGQENLPKKAGYLVISNHRSWTDVPFLVYATTSMGIAKKEIGFLPGVGLGGWLAGAIYFNRKDPKDRARVVEEALFLLKNGANLHLFPEGTRSRNGKISEKVHFRLIEAAFDAGIPIVPVCVWQTERVMPVRPLRILPFQQIGMEIGEAPSRTSFSTAELYSRAVWECVVVLAEKHGANQELSG